MLFERRRGAFESAVNAYFEDLYRYAYWLCRDRWQAEDLVQETLVRAWRGWAGLREPRAAKGWLFTILHREFKRAAGANRPRTIELEAALDEALVEADPGRAIDLDAALRALPEESRDALLMQVLGGLSCAEIAAALGDSPGAVMTRLSRARQALRRRLGAAESESEVRKA